MSRFSRATAAIGITFALVVTSYVAPVAPAAAVGQIVQTSQSSYSSTLAALNTLDVKGRAPKTGYARDKFGKEVSAHDYDGNGCFTRNDILLRDLVNVRTRTGGCIVTHGTLHDPYTNETINFIRSGEPDGYSNSVQIDHVVALSDAWQKGAQQWNEKKRHDFMHDPLNLLAVKGAANAQKSDSDAATWLPSNKSFRCDFVSIQVNVKKKYGLWVTAAEKTAITNLLKGCGATVVLYSGPFLDIPDNHKFVTQINWMYDAHLSTGTKVAGGAEYRPLARLSREAMAAFMFRHYGATDYTAPARSPFIDVPTNHKFYKEIAWMHETGISTGSHTTKGAEYRPLNRLTRSAMAAFMHRALWDGEAWDERNYFIDLAPNQQFKSQINWMYASGLSTGTSTSNGKEYRPASQLSREAMAAFLYRARDMPANIDASLSAQ